MPTFEIEHGGKTYEVDAPDIATAASSFPAAQQSSAPAFDTAADSAARGLPPNPAAEPVAHTGYRAQVNRTMSGNGPQSRPPVPSVADLGKQWGDVGKGVAVGVPAGIAGTPGDIEQIGRWPLSKISSISPNTFLPTSADVGNLIGGQTSSPEEAGGRIFGNMLSPSFALKGASLIGKAARPIAAHALGATTGVGGEAIKGAFNAGQEGGAAADAFVAQMRGGASKAPEVVQTAKGALAQMRQARSDAYNAGKASTFAGDPTVLNFTPIDDAINKAADIGTFKGQSLSASAQKVKDRITQEIDTWRNLDPAQFHTPEGLDALKQKISNLQYEDDLKTAAAPGTPGSIIVNNVRTAIKGQINAQAPGYAKVMSDYSDASDELRNIEQTLSLKPNANVDSSLRKLQSIMRNNANTNYGQRVQLGNTLDENASGLLMPQLAGQALSSPIARGFQGPLSGAGGLTALLTNPQFLPALAATSPRLVGESAFALGKILPNANKGPVLGASNVGMGSALKLDPKLLAAMSPQVLSLLLQTQNPSR